jgi:NAD-dependent deacetylase
MDFRLNIRKKTDDIMITKDTRIVILTGAGISAESGIQTFRASDGLWENHRVEDVATPQGWESNPQLVWSFYQQRRRQLLEVEPNPAHAALVDLEKYVDNFLLITQNVDNLHGKAGSEQLIHMHGELEKLRCEQCNHIEIMMENEHLGEEFISCTQCEGRLRPHVVWFNESPLKLNEIDNALSQCDVFIAIGTSGNVTPASTFTNIAKIEGAHTIGINLDPPMNVYFFDEFLQGKAGEILPALVQKWTTD